jgi:cobaltochelatase CobS
VAALTPSGWQATAYESPAITPVMAHAQAFWDPGISRLTIGGQPVPTRRTVSPPATPATPPTVPTPTPTPPAPAPLSPVYVSGPAPVQPPAASPAPASVVSPGSLTPAHLAAVGRAAAPVPEPEPEKPTSTTFDVVRTTKGAPPTDPANILQYPQPSHTTRIHLTPANKALLDLAWRQHVAGDRQVVALVGPTGTGKTTVIYDLAAAYGVGIYKFDTAGATSFIDWVGSTGVVERNGVSVTEWEPSALMQVVRADGRYAGQPRICIIDEANRAESSAATNALMALTNSVPDIYIPDARVVVPIDPAVMFVYTANVGSAYSGTIPLDPALLNRIRKTIQIDHPERATELAILAGAVPGLDRALAARLVDAARQVRIIADRGDVETGVSTRQVVAAAKDLAFDPTLDPVDVVTAAWLNTYKSEGGERSERQAALAAVEGVLRPNTGYNG